MVINGKISMFGEEGVMACFNIFSWHILAGLRNILTNFNYSLMKRPEI
jgi:hypothetical protein